MTYILIYNINYYYFYMLKYNELEFISICNESKTMSEAAMKLEMHFNTFVKIAKKLKCYKPNQGRKGYKRDSSEYKLISISLIEILDGKHPTYQTYKLKLRLFKEGIKINKCENCKIDEWNNKPISCELDHIDGNRTNHKLNNLRILCPNCHSQTSTFRSKKRLIS